LGSIALSLWAQAEGIRIVLSKGVSCESGGGELKRICQNTISGGRIRETAVLATKRAREADRVTWY
jgi:hypothetical protein